MTASEAYLEAQRRIRDAKQSGQHWLDLGDIEGLEAIPEEIGELTALRELGLGAQEYDRDRQSWKPIGDRWVYSHPPIDISAIEKLTSLTWLDLSRQQALDYLPLGELTKLESLNLMLSSIKDSKALAPLKRLKSLRAVASRLADITHLSSLTSLTELNL